MPRIYVTMIVACGMTSRWLNHAFQNHYDSPGIEGVFFWAGELLAIPITVVDELVRLLFVDSPYYVACVMALLLAFLLDLLIARFISGRAKLRAKKSVEHS